MALKIHCPHCQRPHRLEEPFPPPGTELHCACGATLALTYPHGLVERLRAEGRRFQEEPGAEAEATGPFSPAPLPPAALPVLTPPPWVREGEDESVETELFTPSRATAPAAPPRTPRLPPRGPALPPPPRGPAAPPKPDDELTQVAARANQARLRLTGEPGLARLARPPEEEPTGATEVLGPGALPPAPVFMPPPALAGGAGFTAAPPRTTGKRPPARRRWLGVGLVAALVLLLAGVGVFVGVIAWYSRDLPSVDALAAYQPPTVTVVLDRNGQVLGEIYEKRRYITAYDDIPQVVVQAFVAAEDASFFDHEGFDLRGMLRAAFANLREGRMAQGASTITQQVAKVFLLSSEKKIERKIREVLLATRVEDTFSKEHILFLYLNEIYLGSGAYGVEAASRVYFGKSVADVTLAEAAILAGLPQRPSDYSPHKNWDKARARQEYVLRQMVDNGSISQQEADAALQEEVTVVLEPNPLRLLAPTFTEHVRRHLVDTYGADRVYNEGLVVHTTVDLALQQVAQQAVVKQVQYMDEQMGWRGVAAEERLQGKAAVQAWREEVEASLQEADALRRDPAGRLKPQAPSELRVGERYPAVVISVEKEHAVVGIGAHEGVVPRAWATWMYAPNPETSWRSRKLDDLTKALAPGDRVTVEVKALDAAADDATRELSAARGKAAVRVHQEPELEGAFLAYDLATGGVMAMVGGRNIEASEFNRAIQAQRQVGSTFKPIVYATAIAERDVTTGSLVLDGPLTYSTGAEGLWRPGNYGGDYLGYISLRKALALSRNVCTVRVLERIGIDPVYDMARTLGITSTINKDLAMGLGASSLTMLELTRAYSAFATYGKLVDPWSVVKVLDRDGNVLEAHESKPAPQVLDPTVAGITSWLLQEVARAGTAAATNELGVHLAGKTGTTNDFKDGWFVGYSPGVIASAWVGYDQPRSMGVSSTGGRIALPIWMDFMRVAWPKEKDHPFPEIPDAVWQSIDESTGRAAAGGRSMPFLRGTAPTGALEVQVGQKSAEDLLMLDF